MTRYLAAFLYVIVLSATVLTGIAAFAANDVGGAVVIAGTSVDGRAL